MVTKLSDFTGLRVVYPSLGAAYPWAVPLSCNNARTADWAVKSRRHLLRGRCGIKISCTFRAVEPMTFLP